MAKCFTEVLQIPPELFPGKFKALKTLNQFIINTDYIGITNNAVVTVNNNHIQLTLGGSNPQKVLFKDITTIGNGYSTSANRTSSIPNKMYLGTWNNQGVPNYMEPVRDIVVQRCFHASIIHYLKDSLYP